MDILVCISKVPDTTAKIRFTDNNTKFDESNVQYIVNPSDEWYALVRALELKEKHGGKVSIVMVGTKGDEPIIRKALAIGADEAFRIDAEPTESYFVAFQIANFIKEKKFNFVLTGKETINYNGAEVSGMLAEYLDWPYVAFISKLETDGEKAIMNRDISGGAETVEVQMPFVASASKGLAEQRIPNMRGIMAARTKPITEVEPKATDARTKIKSYALPPEKGNVKIIDPENVEELVELLHKEAKVI